MVFDSTGGFCVISSTATDVHKLDVMHDPTPAPPHCGPQFMTYAVVPLVLKTAETGRSRATGTVHAATCTEVHAVIVAAELASIRLGVIRVAESELSEKTSIW